MQIFYRKSNEEHPEPMKIPGCGHKFTLEQFYDLYEKLMPDDFESECGLPVGQQCGRLVANK